MMDFTGYDDSNKKKTLIAMLIRMAKADMHSHTNENDFLYTLADRYNVDIADVVLLSAGLGSHEEDLPRTERERMKFFFYVLSMMQMDNQVTDSEKVVAKEIGHTLGLNPLMVIDLIRIFTNQLNPSAPEEDINAAILKYLN